MSADVPCAMVIHFPKIRTLEYAGESCFSMHFFPLPSLEASNANLMASALTTTSQLQKRENL